MKIEKGKAEQKHQELITNDTLESSGGGQKQPTPQVLTIEDEVFKLVWDLVPETDDYERLEVEKDLIQRAITETIMLMNSQVELALKNILEKIDILVIDKGTSELDVKFIRQIIIRVFKEKLNVEVENV